MECIHYSITSKSSHHENNEDCHFAGDRYIIVADGMGGESSGDKASRITVDAIDEALNQGLDSVKSESELTRLMLGAVASANSRILEYVDKNPLCYGMGSTVIVAVIWNRKLYISWCGDSRCYRFRKKRLRALTKDHSYVQSLVDKGEISEEDALSHPDSNIITRFVGDEALACHPDSVCQEMADNDLYIFCTDGLSGYCQLEEIEEVVKNNTDISNLPAELHALAKGHNSDDDITIVVVASESYSSKKGDSSLFGWFRRKPQSLG